MEKDKLEYYINKGYSSSKIAKELNCSGTNIRYWLKKFNLETVFSKALIEETKYTDEEKRIKNKKRALERYYSDENKIECNNCKKLIRKSRKKDIYICEECFNSFKKENKGKGSYKYVKPKNHFGSINKKGLCQEHRFIGEIVLNRKFKINEIIHHIDNDRTNNELDNLCFMTRSDHNRFHSYLFKNRLKCNLENLIKSGIPFIRLSDVSKQMRAEIINKYCYHF